MQYFGIDSTNRIHDKPKGNYVYLSKKRALNKTNGVTRQYENEVTKVLPVA